MTTITTGAVLGGRYAIRSRIASGGMGDVWEATDEVLGRPVAVKVLRPGPGQDGGFLARFRAEARHAAALSHPNIATVYDYGEDDGTAYLVMELVRGAPLSDLIREGAPFPADQVRALVGQAALALAAAHDAGVVHRDVKPANILVTPDGTAKLTDFGIARAGDGSGVTVTGEVLGTPDYLSPEQALGQPATGASDLYALGVVAQEMLTGAKPFDMGTPVATALAQVNDAPPPLPTSVPGDLRDVVAACLSKDPADRPADARSVATWLGMPVGADATVSALAVIDPTSRLHGVGAHSAEPTPWWRRRGLLWAAAPLAMLLLLGGFAGGRMLSPAAVATPTTQPGTAATATPHGTVRVLTGRGTGATTGAPTRRATAAAPTGGAKRGAARATPAPARTTKATGKTKPKAPAPTPTSKGKGK
ncbi:MAG TPA: serine/threonine-protein kinase [Intrasporangium sp.]|uniref:serine/threonine-protein kinase n=1 Tax=Intrasporangium sp. TaxID=1925024 RepID=UPI002D787EAE|nr:serine/threonine-protein kinase [Intrasporangium sp.]HET7397042.1 serine/threonine-protein kinase [Intrasporangium sp.]